MKRQFLVLAAGTLLMVSGCSTATVLQTQVGPDPRAGKNSDSDGILRVFSATEQQNDVGFEFPYDQRTDYYIYDWRGDKIKSVCDNNIGQFEAVPRGIRLPPGTYKVKALAAVGLGEWLVVPVLIEPGRTTEVHLNGHWKPPGEAPVSELLYAPGGFPMGWRAPALPTG